MKKKSLVGFAVMICLLTLSRCATSQSSSLLQFKAFNGIRFEYGLLLPEGYSKNNSYEIITVLCEVHLNDQAWDKTMSLAKAIDLKNSILIIPKVPLGNDHWGTHPIHHGFNDLLKHVRKNYGQPNQKMHLIGMEAGQETAFWWTYQSKLLASTSIINGHLWKEDRWDKKWYGNLMSSKIPIYAYEEQMRTKFDMSNIKFSRSSSLDKVIADIEKRNKP